MDEQGETLRAMAQPSMFPVDGELALGGLREPATVRRDVWGVPYLEAATQDDLWFCQGLVTAGERLFQLDLALRAATGRLSEVFGERTLDDDRFARTVGFHRAGARIAERWDDRSVAMHERFRAGVTAWIEAMPAAPVEYAMLDVEPTLPDDVGSWAAAFVYLSWGLSGNALQELLRAWIADRAGATLAADLLPGAGHARGSNAWALAPSRTATGGALLANDPHLDAIQPGVWLEMHLSAPGYRARGVALPWSPGIVLGTTAHHAWGATNVSGDVQDMFVEELSDDGTSVKRGDDWAPLIVHHERIDVRGSDPVELTVRESSRGPLLERFPVGESEIEYAETGGIGSAVALSWTGLEHAIQPSLALEAASASSFDGFRRAVQRVTCPGQNFVYADVSGTIGSICTGVYPIRRNGDGTVPVTAADADHAWLGAIDAEELPWTIDPERGFLVTANDRPHDESYPLLIGHDFHPTHRADRIGGALRERSDHDVASCAALQADTVSTTATAMLPVIVALEPSTDDQRLALELLADWDGDVTAGSAAALVFQVWSGAVARRRLRAVLGDELFGRYHADREAWHCRVLPALVRDPSAAGDLLEAFDEAIAQVREQHGDDVSGWRWGAAHRLRLAHPLAAIPGLQPMFTAVDAEVGGDETTVSQTAFDARRGFEAAVIASWRAVYDLADLDRSVGVLPAGISGNPASPHWNDQAPLWLAGETHPLPFTEAAIEAAAVSVLHLRPGTISG